MAGATSYEVEHRKHRIIMTVAQEEVKINEVNSTTFTISDLRDETLYPIRIRAKNGSSNSDWSNTIHTYPTKTTVGPNSIVRTITILGFLDLTPVDTSNYDPPVGEFAFVLCKNTLPADDIATKGRNEREITASLILDGIREWSEKTGVGFNQDQNKVECSNTDMILKANQLSSINKIQLESPGSLWMSCNLLVPLDLNGCVVPNSYANPNPMTRVHMFLNNTLAIDPNSINIFCSKMFQIAMHEAGHIYGLGHSTIGETTMRQYYLDHDHICSLTLSDVIAITKIYQSR